MTKSILYTLIFALHAIFTVGNVVENNKTNTAVYVNHVSSCNYNKNTLELVCVNEGENTLVQYNNVKTITMCEYHFCVLFRTSPTDVLCTGYQWSHGKHMYDPLSTSLAVNITNEGSPRREVNEWFLGYNLMTDAFVQNKVSRYNGTVESILCDTEGYSTCVAVKSPTGELESACGGLDDLDLRDPISSFLLGINLLLLISGSQYIGMRYLFNSLRESIVMNNLIIPCISMVIAFILLTVTQSILVKSAMFVIGAFVGIVVGYIVSEFMLRVVACFGPLGKVETDEEMAQEVRMLGGAGYDKDEGGGEDSVKFEIGEADDDLDEISLDGDDEGTTTIELAEVDEKSRKELFSKRI